MQDLTGHDPARIGVAYWCDAAILAQHEMPAVVFGPSGTGKTSLLRTRVSP